MKVLGRTVIDVTVHATTYAAIGYAYGRWRGLAAVVIIAAYGAWCFFDGANL